MTKQVQLLAICLLLGVTNACFGQKKTWKIKVRQSFESSDSKSEPATIVLTFPYEKSFSYAIDGGIALEKEKLQSIKKIVAEYHRNTLIDKEQNNMQLGFAGEFILRDLLKIPPTNYFLNATAKFVRDGVASTGSVLQSTELGILSNAFNTPVRIKRTDKNFFLISPTLGYEYQNTFDAKTDNRDSLLGNVLRGTGKLKISYTHNQKVIIPKSAQDRKKIAEGSSGIGAKTVDSLRSKDSDETIKVPLIQFFASGAMRYDMINTTETPAGWHPYLQAGIDYIFSRNESLEPRFTIGLSFVTGENPSQGLRKQKYWLLGLKFIL